MTCARVPALRCRPQDLPRVHVLAGIVLAVVAFAPALAAQQPTPSFGSGVAMLQSGDFAGAAEVFRAITEAQPGNGRVWILLGQAELAQGNPAGAREAFGRAAEIQGFGPTATLYTGLTHAAEGNNDEAFRWLERAKATGRVDMTQVGLSSSAAGLRTDPRYRSLFPTAAEFADPFVEPARILQEWRGETAGDQFGWIARNVGDVDGDGVADVTTSAPSWASPEGANAGKVYVYSSSSGALLWSAHGKPGDQLGLGIEAAGDVNADGIPDVVAGAPGGGRALVYSGRDGTILLTFTSDDPANDVFGRKVADLGDVDGDGHDDVLVGAPGAGGGAGAAHVYSGADGTRLATFRGEGASDAFGSSGGGLSRDGRSWVVVGAPGAGASGSGSVYVYRDLSGTPAFVIESDDTGAALGGMFVSVVGDVDGDRVPDVYASDWSNNAKGPSTGRIYVHSGRTGERLLTLTGEAGGDGFGIGVADAGDVDGDGHDDLVVGAWQHGSAAPSGGKVYLYSGKDGSLVREWTGKVPGETFGFDTTGMGDVDGDGNIDLLLTSAWSAVNGTRSGRMFIVSGRD